MPENQFVCQGKVLFEIPYVTKERSVSFPVTLTNAATTDDAIKSFCDEVRKVLEQLLTDRVDIFRFALSMDVDAEVED